MERRRDGEGPSEVGTGCIVVVLRWLDVQIGRSFEFGFRHRPRVSGSQSHGGDSHERSRERRRDRNEERVARHSNGESTHSRESERNDERLRKPLSREDDARVQKMSLQER